MLNEGNKYQGEYGEQGRLLERRGIAIAKEPLDKSYGDIWLPAQSGIQAQLAGSSQIFPVFVQVQIVYLVFHHTRFIIT